MEANYTSVSVEAIATKLKEYLLKSKNSSNTTEASCHYAKRGRDDDDDNSSKKDDDHRQFKKVRFQCPNVSKGCRNNHREGKCWFDKENWSKAPAKFRVKFKLFDSNDINIGFENDEEFEFELNSYVSLEDLDIANAFLHGALYDQIILDSGSSHHICRDILKFEKIKDIDPVRIRGLSGTIFARKEGNVKLEVEDADGKIKVLKLENVLFVPEAPVNLASVKCLTREGFVVNFNEKGFMMKKDNITIKGELVGNSYSFVANEINGNLQYLHKLLGHIGQKRLEATLKNIGIKHVNHDKRVRFVKVVFVAK